MPRGAVNSVQIRVFRNHGQACEDRAGQEGFLVPRAGQGRQLCRWCR